MNANPGRIFTLLCFAFLLALSSCKKDSAGETADETLAPLNTCVATVPTGTMTVNADGSFLYNTAGGGTIKYSVENGIQITHKNYLNFKLEFWGYFIVNGQKIPGSTHETLNGKYIKDKLSSNRSFVFPDGAKVTWLADSTYGKVNSITIFEGAQTHHFNTNCNKLERSITDAAATRELDNLQPDGETSSIEISPTGLLFVNIYVENSPGVKETKRVILGEIFIDKPDHVNDYYDDPRLGAT